MTRKGLWAAMACVAMPAVMLVAGSTAAQAAGVSGHPDLATGNVSGKIVSAATGHPLSGICVNVVEVSGNRSAGTSAPTTGDGVWSVDGIFPATDYTAYAYHCSGTGNFVGQWYDGQDFQSTATQFAVKSAATTRHIDFSLSVGGSVSGQVTDSTTGSPIKDILVIAYWTDNSSASTFSACTNATGHYKLNGVPTSGAYIEFVPNDCGVTSNYSSVFYLNAPSYGTATFVPVAANKTTMQINQQLTAG